MVNYFDLFESSYAHPRSHMHIPFFKYQKHSILIASSKRVKTTILNIIITPPPVDNCHISLMIMRRGGVVEKEELFCLKRA